MTHYTEKLWRYFSGVMFLTVCFIIAACIVTFAYGSAISVQEVGKQVMLSFFSVLIFIIVLLLCRMIYHLFSNHKNLHRSSYHEFINELEKALDRIAQGDFEVRVATKKGIHILHDEGHHISDIADKINSMAVELGERETMRQDFVSNVSHEIQSPLTSICGFVELLKDDSLSRQEQLRYIGIVESESLRLSRLSENLLRLSTLESAFVELKPKKYSLSRQIKEIIVLLEPQWSAKNIEVELSGEQVDIFADQDLLSQVWINLLNNSIKFTQVNGKISISVSKNEGGIETTIADMGVGMTREELSHIFERFYMADKARSRKMGGSGLGLSIVKKIVQMHSGYINVDSKKDVGTTFKVIIPQNIELV